MLLSLQTTHVFTWKFDLFLFLSDGTRLVKLFGTCDFDPGLYYCPKLTITRSPSHRELHNWKLGLNPPIFFPSPPKGKGKTDDRG